MVELIRTEAVTSLNDGSESLGPLSTSPHSLALPPSAFPLDAKYSTIYRRRKLIRAEIEYAPTANLRHDGQLQIYFDFHAVSGEASPSFMTLMSSTSRQIVRGPVGGTGARLDLKSKLDSALHQEVDTSENVFSRLGALRVCTAVIGYAGDAAPEVRSVIGYLRVKFTVAYTDPLMEIAPAAPAAPHSPQDPVDFSMLRDEVRELREALARVAASAAPPPPVPSSESLRLVSGGQGTEPAPQ